MSVNHCLPQTSNILASSRLLCICITYLFILLHTLHTFWLISVLWIYQSYTITLSSSLPTRCSVRAVPLSCLLSICSVISSCSKEPRQVELARPADSRHSKFMFWNVNDDEVQLTVSWGFTPKKQVWRKSVEFRSFFWRGIRTDPTLGLVWTESESLQVDSRNDTTHIILNAVMTPARSSQVYDAAAVLYGKRPKLILAARQCLQTDLH